MDEMLKRFDEYVALAEQAHGHMCAGQILGLRLALYGMKLLGLDDPDRRRPQAAGDLCGDRSLRHRCDPGGDGMPPGQARAEVPRFRQGGGHVLRSAGGPRGARSGARELETAGARDASGDRRQERSSRCEPIGRCRTNSCSITQWVRVRLGPEEFPGYKGERVVCAECGEGINFKREVVRDGRTLCKACAGERYYEMLP